MRCCLPRYPLLLMLTVGSLLPGCSSCSCCAVKPLDREVRRCSEAGFQALAESTAAEAIVHYHCAVKRAWAMNDYPEIARNALNLASALFANDQCSESRDWILEARAAFHCAGMDVTPAYLLEAKVARKQQRFGESEALLSAASRSIESIPFCNLDELARSAGGFNAKLLDAASGSQATSCTNSKRKRRLQAQTHLEVAELACDLCDVQRAQANLEQARALRGHGDDLIDAGIARVGGRICQLQGRCRQAAAHYCAEAGILRAHGRYREMTDALEAAGTAFESVAACGEAAEAFHQAARSHFGRGEYLNALRLIESARRCGEASSHQEIRRRVALLFREVSREIAEQSGPSVAAAPSASTDKPPPVPEVPNADELMKSSSSLPQTPDRTEPEQADEPEEQQEVPMPDVGLDPADFIRMSRVPPPFDLVLPE